MQLKGEKLNTVPEEMTIQPESLFHVPHSNWAYPYTREKYHLRVRTKRNNVGQVYVLAGDKYDWENRHQELKMSKAATDRYYDYWEIEIEPEHKRFSYAFRFESSEESLWMIESGIYTDPPAAPGGYYEMPYMHEVDLFKAPDWAKSAVFYQIMPDRFANGDSSNDPEGTQEWGGKPTTDSFFGGDLQGIIDHLDYLTDLGITAIYLTPIFEAPSNHKYDTTDYMKVDAHFGDVELLKKLVEAAHSKNIKVVLDAVFNHASAQSFAFKDVIEHGKGSRYVDWFHIYSFPVRVKEGEPNYDTFGFFAQMPKLNTANPETKQYLLDVAAYWLSEVKIDGWRLDVANEIDHTFWRDFRKRVKEINPQAYIIGEVWSDSMRWLQGDQFDSVMNYPLSDRLLEFLKSDEMDAHTFAGNIGNLIMRYPQQANEVLFNLLASHDTPRLLTQLGGDKRKLKLAIAFLFTFTGTPCIFYGDEIGLEGEADPDCRKCMIWDKDQQDRELFGWYEALITLRKTNPVLHTGRLRFLKAEKGERCLIYERTDDRTHFTIWMNHSDQPVTLSHPLEGDWQDALTQETVNQAKGPVTVELEPFGCRILVTI